MLIEETFLDFKCPYCGEPNSVPQTTVGKLQECFNCLESLIVPEVGSEFAHKLPFPLQTTRLILRRFTSGDWKDMLELAKDDEFPVCWDGLTVVLPAETVSEESVLRWLQSDSLIKLTSPGQPFRLAIELKDGGKLAGYVRFNFMDPENLQGWFEINLHHVHQRKDYGSEAVNALLGFCFNTLGLHRVATNFDSRNRAASHLCEKLGMRREAEFVKDCCFDGEWRNTVWYGILEEEYCDDSAEAPGSAEDPA